MSEYKDVTLDIPKRLLHMDKEFKTLASKSYEVTYLLMKLMMVFVFIRERISDKSGATVPPPGLLERIETALEFNTKFLNSKYNINNDNSNWRYIKNIRGFNDLANNWSAEVFYSPLSKEKLCSSIFRIIRNAAGHSNFHFISTKPPEITHIIMGSQTGDLKIKASVANFEILMAPVSELEFLVDEWLKALADLKASPEQIVALLEDAA